MTQICEIEIKTHTPHCPLSGTQKALRVQTCTTNNQLHLPFSVLSAFKIPRISFVMKMSDSEFLVIGKVLSADLDADGALHITLKNSNQFWAQIATKHLRQLQGQIIKAEIKTWTPTTTITTAKQTTEKNTT